jgi:hypothetical protein
MNNRQEQIDNALQIRCEKLIAQHGDALKEELLHTIVLPNLSRLRGGNNTRWNETGWYSALDDVALCRVSVNHDRAAGFPVPTDCGKWHSVEKDSRNGEVFRFFYEEAWLDLVAPAVPCTLSFTVPHVVMPEALEQLAIRVCDRPVAHSTRPQKDACASVTIVLNSELIERSRIMGRLHVTLCTPIVAVPALIYKGSTDRRRLSLAVTCPTLRQT